MATPLIPGMEIPFPLPTAVLTPAAGIIHAKQIHSVPTSPSDLTAVAFEYACAAAYVHPYGQYRNDGLIWNIAHSGQSDNHSGRLRFSACSIMKKMPCGNPQGIFWTNSHFNIGIQISPL
jgi:hypothetical protein